MIKAWIVKRKKKVEARKNLKKYKTYYKAVKAGQLFIQFIQQDIAQQKKNKVNRAQRRRFEKDLCQRGILTEEMVQYYKAKIDNTLAYINMQLNPPKRPKIKISKNKPKGADISKEHVVAPKTKTPFNDDDLLKAEYKLVQEKKSNLSASERKKVVSLYKQKFERK